MHTTTHAVAHESAKQTKTGINTRRSLRKLVEYFTHLKFFPLHSNHVLKILLSSLAIRCIFKQTKCELCMRYLMKIKEFVPFLKSSS